MKRKYGLLLALLGTVGLLNGCSFFQQNHSTDIPSQRKICSQLRHEMVFNSPNGPSSYPANPNVIRNNPIQQAKNAQQYKHYNCEDVTDQSN